jgi:hypothetical protein
MFGPSFFPVKTHSKAAVWSWMKTRVTATLKSGSAVKLAFVAVAMASRPDVSGKPGMTTFPVGS